MHRLRPAVRADAGFLLEMACEAANWDPQRMRPRPDLLADPAVLRVVRGWTRPGDTGVVAIDGMDAPVGACWYRVLARDQAGAAFVGAGVPELTIGVRPVWRARGVGRALLAAVCDAARDAGHQRLALRVDRRNVAHRLYRSEGFAVAGALGDQDLMVRALR